MNSRPSKWYGGILFLLFAAIIIWQWRHNAALRHQNTALQQISNDHAALQIQRDDLARERDSHAAQLQSLRAQVAAQINLTNELDSARHEHALALARSIKLENEVNDLKIELAQKPRVPRLGGWLGAAIGDALSENQDSTNGVAIRSIIEGGPAQRANLETGDIIIGIDGYPVMNAQDLKQVMAQKTGGQPVVFDVVRKDSAIKLRVTPSDWPQ